MSHNYSYKRGALSDDTSLYMRDYNTSIKIKKILARLSLVLLLILFASGFFLADYIGEELAAIMIIAPVILAIVWFVVAWFYKVEPPPIFDPPVDIKAEFGKAYFQSPQSIEEEEASSRISKLPSDASLDASIVETVFRTKP